MQIQTSLTLRIIYCLAVLGAVFPFHISDWARLTIGPSNTVPYVGSILLIILGAYRIFCVLKDKNTLNSHKPAVFPLALRMLGILAMALGALVTVAWIFRPFIMLLIFGNTREELSPYVIGVCFAMARGLAPLGVVLFEASRLMGFEAANKAPTADKNTT